MIAHQASCVALGERGVLIEGLPGSGKSSLALALIDRGAVLVGDDGVLLERDGGGVIVHPHPRTQGLLEVRNLGLLTFPVRDRAIAALVVRLDPAAPRYVDAPAHCSLCGTMVPLVLLTPNTSLLPIKVELALRGCAERA